MNFFIWKEAAQMARGGKPVRRYGWLDRWLVHTQGNVWQIIPHVTAADPSVVPARRVVRSADFGNEEFLAEDWTDATPEQNNVCVRPGKTTFVPPGVHLSAIEHEGGIRLIATLGTGSSIGSYWLRFWVNGVRVATREATASGNFIVDVPRTEALRYECLLDVESALPLPQWLTQRRAQVTLSASPPLPGTLAVHFTVVGLGTYTHYIHGLEPSWQWHIGEDDQDYFGTGYVYPGMAGWGLRLMRLSDGRWMLTFEWEDTSVTTSTSASSISEINPSPITASFPSTSAQAVWDEEGTSGGPAYGSVYTLTNISVAVA